MDLTIDRRACSLPHRQWSCAFRRLAPVAEALWRNLSEKECSPYQRQRTLLPLIRGAFCSQPGFPLLLQASAALPHSPLGDVVSPSIRAISSKMISGSTFSPFTKRCVTSTIAFAIISYGWRMTVSRGKDTSVMLEPSYAITCISSGMENPSFCACLRSPWHTNPYQRKHRRQDTFQKCFERPKNKRHCHSHAPEEWGRKYRGCPPCSSLERRPDDAAGRPFGREDCR